MDEVEGSGQGATVKCMYLLEWWPLTVSVERER